MGQPARPPSVPYGKGFALYVLGRTMLQGNAFKHFRSAHVSVERKIQGRNQGPEAPAAGVWLPAPGSAEGGRGTVLCAV